MKWLISVCSIVMILIFNGCSGYPMLIRDYDTYSSDKAKSEAETYHFGEKMYVSHSSEYYESGRLKSEQWYERNRPIVKLEFYNSGLLKAEERYYNGKITYGAYYKEDGSVDRIVGKRLREEVAKVY